MHGLLEDLKARGMNCKQILDIGANAGHWSRMAHTVFPEAAFCLVEPQEEMRPTLEALCADYPNMQYHLAGAGCFGKADGFLRKGGNKLNHRG